METSNGLIQTEIIAIPDPLLAAKFQTFLKYEPVITGLINAGVFDRTNAHVTLDFNHRGHIMDVRVSIETQFRTVELDKKIT